MIPNMMEPPVLIIAAGRSGTKMLRDILCTHSRLVTWPCDEINPIWRYGHARYPTDELRPCHATDRVIRYVRGRFEALVRSSGGRKRIVEKTCANSLRVEYVHRILPEARFLHLVRDGRDVAASARRRWTGDVEAEYVLRKARWVPWVDLPWYALSFASRRVRRSLSPEKRLPTWGPRFDGIDSMTHDHALIEVCGVQWSRCVDAAREGFRAVPSDQILEIRYEELVRRPGDVFAEIFRFCDLEFESDCRRRIDEVVTEGNIGKHRADLNEADLARLMARIGPILEREGYIGGSKGG